MSASQSHGADKSRQPLHNDSGQQSTDAESICSREPEVQPPKAICMGQIGHTPLRQEIPATLQNVSSRIDETSNKISLPKSQDQKSETSQLESADSNLSKRQGPVDIQETRQSQLPQSANIAQTSANKRLSFSGLAKSRWAEPNLSQCSAPIGKTNPSGFSPCLAHNQQPVTAKNQVVNRTVAMKLGQSSLTKQSSEVCQQDSKELSGVQKSRHNEPTAMGKQTKKPDSLSDPLPLAALTLVQAIGESLTTETKPTSSLNPVDLDNVVKPTLDKHISASENGRISGSDMQKEVHQDMKNQAQRQKELVNEMAISTGEEESGPDYSQDHKTVWTHNAHKMKTDFLAEGTQRNMDCDVDTYKSAPPEPIDYQVMRSREIMSHAQLTMTSELRMREFMAKQAEEEILSAAQILLSPRAKEAVLLTKRPPNPYEVKIPCYLRPIGESDIAAVQAIYNQEVIEGYTVMDIEPVSIDAFQIIRRRCLARNMPFVVAVEGRHGSGETRQKVIGFALITAVYRGIAGSFKTLSNFGAKLLVIVKPEYRRKKIGTALIDVLMASSAATYTSKGGYQFVDTTAGPNSLYNGCNLRRWYYLDMDIMIRSNGSQEMTQESEEFKWISNFLETRFLLLPQKYDERCCFKQFWLDKVTFRHSCGDRNDPEDQSESSTTSYYSISD